MRRALRRVALALGAGRRGGGVEQPAYVGNIGRELGVGGTPHGELRLLPTRRPFRHSEKAASGKAAGVGVGSTGGAAGASSGSLSGQGSTSSGTTGVGVGSQRSSGSTVRRWTVR